VARRLLLRSLVLAGILLACFAHLIWNGWHAREVVGGNIPSPRLSSGHRDIDLWHPSTSFGRVYDMIFWRTGESVKPVRSGARLEIQLASNGKTRLLVVRKGHPNTDVSWRDILLGREHLQIVADRGWIDLGPLPDGEERFDYQITGFLPGGFGFAEPYQPKHDDFSGFRMRRPDSPLAKPVREILRYRFVSAAPVEAGETLARFLFFISCSRVLQVTGVVALALLFAGWWWLWEGRTTRAVAALVSATTLMHACCIPPFQGEDENMHEATIEALIWSPSMPKGQAIFPKSLALVSEAIDFDRFVTFPEIPIDLASPGHRATLAVILQSPLAEEALVPAGSAYAPSRRAFLYYNSFRAFGPLLRSMSVFDRMEAYVVISAVASLLLFGAGLLFLSRSGADPALQLVYGLAALLPYSVGVVASCTNYSLAIGIGQFLVACLVGGVLAESVRKRLLAAALFMTASLIGVGVWDDFVFFAIPATVVLTILAAHTVYRMPAGPGRRVAMGSMLLVGIPLAGTIAFALATGRMRYVITSFGAVMPRGLGGFEDPSFWLLLGAAAAPFVVSLVLALAIESSRGMSESGRERAARVRSASLALLFVVMFLVTTWKAVPFEQFHLDFPDEVAAHWSSFWSNNFAFDQDVLSWKMYWGVFGWADVFYPDALYALARWVCIGLFLALPLLSWRFTHRSPSRSALLLVVAGYALTACIVTNSLRYFVPSNPWGRFILPAFPLVAVPLLARAALAAPAERSTAWRLAIALFVALHVWTSITLIGSRYAIGL
jgi:hypothetical protein